MKFSTIAIIYNPNSTGSSERLAKQYARKLRERLPQQSIDIIPTQFAGHGRKLAYTIAHKEAHPLIISSSGDGGYHDIINGVMDANNEGRDATTSLLPAGNANDHHRNVTSGDVVELIATHTDRHIDLLKLTGTSDGKPVARYAHSYIGFGFTPDVGNELNKTKLNPLREVWIVIRTLLSIRPVRLTIDDETHSYDSVIFSNVDSMSKVLKLSQHSKINDGKFEVSIFHRRQKFQLIALLLKASLVGIKEDAKLASFSLSTTKHTPVQADGEIIVLDPNTSVTITAEKQVLSCIL